MQGPQSVASPDDWGSLLLERLPGRAAFKIDSSVAWERENSAVSRPSDRTMIRCARAMISGSSDEFPYEITLAPQRCLRLGRHYELERVRQLLALLEG